MIYNLRHRTTYTYAAEVSFARCVLRLTPRSTPSQTVLQSAVEITPFPQRSSVRTGPFGEEVRTVVIEAPHRVLLIDATARVDVHASEVAPAEDSLAWEDLRELSLESTDLSPDGPAVYLYPTARTRLVGGITEYARESFTPRRPVIAAAAELMTRIHQDFTYDSKATQVSTPAETAFKSRRGVCQDFTHIMVSGLRALGLPAAYVSGYLRTIPPPGSVRLEGADATHAWVSLWCGPDHGWIGFDPTNAVLVQNDHVVLAVGRDYSDVAPIDGIILAPGRQTLKVEVDVVPEDEWASVYVP